MPIAAFDLLTGAHTCPLSAPETRCSVKACPFPHADNEAVCEYHFHFFDFAYSLTDGEIGIEDLYDEENPTIPLFYIGKQYDLENYEKTLKTVRTSGEWRTDTHDLTSAWSMVYKYRPVTKPPRSERVTRTHRKIAYGEGK